MFKRLTALTLTLCLMLANGLALTKTMDEVAWQRIKQNLENSVSHPVPEEYRISVAPGDWHAAWEEINTLSILLMGPDAQDAAQKDGQADLILLCAVNLKTGAIRLLSVPETAYIQAEGVPEPVWIKHVHCLGGPALMVQAVNDALGLPVTKYCAVNLHSFVAALNQLGGVTMQLSDYEAGALGLDSGENLLTGSQALNYVKLSGEGNRQSRSQELLSALSRQIMANLSLRTVATLLNFVITAVETNLSYDNLTDIVFAVLDSEGGLSIATQTLSSLSEDAGDISRAFLYGN